MPVGPRELCRRAIYSAWLNRKKVGCSAHYLYQKREPMACEQNVTICTSNTKQSTNAVIDFGGDQQLQLNQMLHTFKGYYRSCTVSRTVSVTRSLNNLHTRCCRCLSARSANLLNTCAETHRVPQAQRCSFTCQLGRQLWVVRT